MTPTEEQKEAAERYVYENLTDYGIDHEYLEQEVEKVASLLSQREQAAAENAKG